MIQNEIYSPTRYTELNCYEISSFGKVIKDQNINNEVELQVNSIGHQYFDTERQRYFVSDLVLESFFKENDITKNPRHNEGKTPMYLVEHLDGDKTNNRVSNLRPLSIYEYVKIDSSGHVYRSNHKGVFYCRIDKKWYAEVCTPDNDICIGSRDTEEEAIKLLKYAI